MNWILFVFRENQFFLTQQLENNNNNNNDYNVDSVCRFMFFFPCKYHFGRLGLSLITGIYSDIC